MKKLLVLLALISTFTIQASHFMGGIIQVAQTSPDSVSIGMYVVGDQFPTLPQYVTLERWEMNSQGWYDLDGYITLTKINSSTHQGFNTANYGSDYINLDSNKYRFIYTNCCWPILNNSTNSNTSEFVISTDYWHVPNNTTPFAENPMWINMAKDSTNNVMKPIWGIYNCFFTNPDGDSVNFYKTELYSSYSNGVFVPQVQSTTCVAANNDSIIFVSSHLGAHAFGFQIDKYRSGYLLTTQRIQWTFISRSSTLNVTELELEKDPIGVWDWQGRYIQGGVEGLPTNKLYLIRYNDGSYKKIKTL
jgi:hypothetical protein